MKFPLRSNEQSLAARLTLFYTLLSLGVLSVIGLVFSTAFRYQLAAEATLLAKHQIVSLHDVMLELGDAVDDLSERPEWVERGINREGLFSRILWPDGTVLAETPEMEAGTDVFGPCGQIGATPPARDWQSASGVTYLLACMEGYGGGTRDRPLILQVALDIDERLEILENLRRLIVVVVAFGVVASGVGSFVLARRGLRPLSRVTEVAERISASDLSLRTDPEQWPRELKPLSQAFDDMLGRLEDSFTRLTHFSSDIAHELRGPLHRLLSRAEVTLSQARSLDDYRVALTDNVEGLQQMAELIERMLFLARAENSLVVLQRQDFDLRAELDKLHNFFGMEAEERGIELQVSGNFRINADAPLFRRALSNLIGNALRHTPPGGWIAVDAEELRDRWRIQVTDSGPGIDAQHLPHVFDRHYRADTMRVDEPAAAGLGLSIAKTIVELHGGSIQASNVPNAGACFVIELPRPPHILQICNPS